MFSSIRSIGFITVIALAGCTAAPDPLVFEDLAESSAVGTSKGSTGVEVVAENLSIPWGIAFLPDGDLLVTERTGTIVRIGKNQQKYPIQGVRHRGEGGLLGIALHPDFAENQWIYVYLTTQTSAGVQNRIHRYRLAADQLIDQTEILSGIPGSTNHDGGRIAFGPDGLLYATTGDAQNENLAQDTASLAGKILRIDDQGKIPADNPFGNAVYSYGHRNPQGITWDDQGRLWSTEHGRSVIRTGYDELNLIEKGKNYGWPTVEGPNVLDGMVSPVIHSGASDTWAPASAAFANGSIYFGGLRGETLYQAVLNRSGTPELREHFVGEYGRIREVVVGPDGFLYITTSNRDGRGRAGAEDDQILRVNVSAL